MWSRLQLQGIRLSKFAIEYEFQHITSSPNYHAKRIMKRACNSKHDVYISLLDFRNTPTEEMLSSPAQILMSRPTKSPLPSIQALLEQKVPISAPAKIKHNKNRKCESYNRTAKELPEHLDIPKMEQSYESLDIRDCHK